MSILNSSFQEFVSKRTLNDFSFMVDSTTNILQKERVTNSVNMGRVDGGLVEIQIPKNLVIIGDLHGDSKSLIHILSRIKYERFLDEPQNKLIFLGDYVDRGTDSLGILYTICYLKLKYPQSVILMRGNHEAPVEFPFSSHDLPSKIAEAFVTNEAQLLYKKILSLFANLSLATIIHDTLLLVHGGLPTSMLDKNSPKLIAHAAQSYRSDRVLEELLWNDPSSHIQNGKNWEESRRGIGKHFSHLITRRWLDISGTKVVVRGHEPCHGFKIDHNGMILTLFSCKESYPRFDAAYLYVSGDQLLSVKDAYDLSCYVKKLET